MSLVEPIITNETGLKIVAAIENTEVTQQRISEINEAANTIKEEVLESIPKDYSELSEKVIELSKLENSPTVYPEAFGAYGDGIHDDTKAIQDAIDSGKHVVLSKKYLVSVNSSTAGTALKLKSNLTIEFVNGAKLMMATNAYENACVMRGAHVDNVKICGNGSIIGDKKTHAGSSGEYGHGILFYAATNVEICGLSIEYNWGDGVTIASYNEAICKSVFIHNCNISNNSRNNISIVAVDGCIVDSCILNNADRTAPMAGIDVEPNETAEGLDYVRNCKISNCIATGNKWSGFQVTNFTTKQNNHCIIENVFTDTQIRAISRSGSHLVEMHNVTYKANPSDRAAINRSAIYVESNETTTTIIDGTIDATVDSGVSNKSIIMTGDKFFNFDGKFKVVGSKIVDIVSYGFPDHYGNNSIEIDHKCDYSDYTQNPTSLFNVKQIQFLNEKICTENLVQVAMYGGIYRVPENSLLYQFYAGSDEKIPAGSEYTIINEKETNILIFGRTIAPKQMVKFKSYISGSVVEIERRNLNGTIAAISESEE